jgi:hypothetical protein
MKFIVFFILIGTAVGQEASDYYNRPVQELQEKIYVQDTILPHRGGWPQCYDAMMQLAHRKKEKDPRFKSIAIFDSESVVQVTLHADCRALRSTGAVLDYYVALTARTNSVKVEFWNIYPKSKECDAGFRISLIKEIADSISNFCDSTKYTHVPYRGYGDPHAQPQLPAVAGVHVDSVTDRLFAALIADSIRKADSIAHETVRADSIAKAELAARSNIEVVIIDTGAIQKEIDSTAKVVSADSVIVHRRDLVMFKGQAMVSCRGKINVDDRLDCLDSLLAHKLRTAPDALQYLSMLLKFCTDKCDMFKAEVPIVPDDLKYRAVAAFHRAQETCAKVQNMQARVPLSREARIPTSQ